MIKKLSYAILTPLTLVFATPVSASCGASFCTVNTDWNAQGVINQPGARFDLRYEFIDQDRLMAGSNRVAAGEIPRHDDEISTFNRNLVLGFNYTTQAGWGVNLQVPWVSRDHFHIHHHHGEQLDERWDIKKLGDARITVRMPLTESYNLGLLVGLKLPTGKTDVTNDHNDRAERTLQPGTGSTDTLLGLTYHSISRGAHSWFSQALWQRATTERDSYRPGDQLGVDLGYRFAFNDRFSTTLQLNAQLRGRDKGSNAKPEDSGSRFLHLSPGIVYALSPDVQVYAFAQFPLYAHVNGVQLTASKNMAMGLSWRF